MLARVTYKSLSSMPGVLLPPDSQAGSAEAKKEEAALSTSAAYTLQENLLIKWLNLHVAATAPLMSKSVGVCDFQKDLRDGAVFAQAVASHVPHLKDAGGPLDGYVPSTRVSEHGVCAPAMTSRHSAMF
jgi:hypothetical protein